MAFISQNQLFLHALVTGAFGAAAIALMVIYSRRGSRIYLAYAALFLCLAWLVTRYEAVSFAEKFFATVTAFAEACIVMWIAVERQAGLQRSVLRDISAIAIAIVQLRADIPGYLWRIGARLAVGAIACAGTVYVAT